MCRTGFDLKCSSCPQPRFCSFQVSEEDLHVLMEEMDTNKDGNVTLKEFSAFINLDDHEPLYQPLFDGRRRNVNILQVPTSIELS